MRAQAERVCHVFHFADVEVVEAEFSIVKAGERLPVEPKAFKVLLFLLRNPQKLITKEVLLDAVWGETAVSENSLTRSIALLRRLLGDDTHVPRFIETVATVGYRLVCQVEVVEDANGGLGNSNGDSLMSPPEGISGPAPVVPIAANAQAPQQWWQFKPDLKLPFQITVARSSSFIWLAAGVFIVVLTAFLIGLAVTKLARPSATPPVVKAVIKLEPGLSLGLPTIWGRPARTAMAISRDGHFIVYSAIAGSPGPDAKPRLYLRRTDQSEARPIAGAEGGEMPFLSPDDRWVGFWTGGKLMKVSVDGGVPVTLTNLTWPFGASWTLDNTILFASGSDNSLFRVSAEGGEAESLTAPDRSKQEYSHRLPHCLPDGKSALFTIMSETFDLHPRVALLDVKTRKWRVLIDDAADARYVPPGYLVFLRQGTLMAVPFDLGRLEVMGQQAPVLANVMQSLNGTNDYVNQASGQFSISDSGWLVYAEGGIFPDRQNSLVWVDRQGRTEAIAAFKAPFFAPRLSPDGKQIAYQTLGKESQVWVYDINRGTASRLTGEGRARWPNWTPDGKRLVFGWCKEGAPNLYWQPADGSGAMERLTKSDFWQSPGSWSPDGATLAFAELKPKTLRHIFLLDLKSHGTAPFLNSSATEAYPELSPDGRWMAYTSDETGRLEVYVRPFPGPGGKWLISQEGGTEPLWARSGKQLYYRSLDGKEVWAVDFQTGAGFTASKPRRLLKMTEVMGTGAPIRSRDVSLDGQRLLMVKLEDTKPTPVTELVLIVNWAEDLKLLAPTGKK
jgi:Tol biopolymer transport system component/DNA-binding winged helix-turn-helix (wHTH) protein